MSNIDINTIGKTAVAEQILARLAELGEDADQIAESLRERGIKGRCGDQHRCPLYNYLHADIPAVDAVDETDVYFDNERGRVRTPAAVSGFVDRFDSGQWPNLVEEVPA